MYSCNISKCETGEFYRLRVFRDGEIVMSTMDTLPELYKEVNYWMSK